MDEQKTPDTPELTKSQEFSLDLFAWLQALVMAILALVLLFTFVGRIMAVDGTSMLPTLHHKDLLLVRSIGYTPKQGDIIVLTKDFDSHTGESIVKRVVAVGNQTVRIDYAQSKVYVDDVALDEPYINESIMLQPTYNRMAITELTVPEGSVFVLGDNRNNSTDSRHVDLGAIDERYILGKASMVFFPFSNIGLLG